MEFKKYQSFKIKNFLKTFPILFLSNGVNREASNWVKIEQGLKTTDLNYYKSCNMTLLKTLKVSYYRNLTNLIKGSIFFLTLNSKKRLSVDLLIRDTLELLKYHLLIFKLNKKMYLITQIKKLNSFSYVKIISIFYQFLLISFKLPGTLD